MKIYLAGPMAHKPYFNFPAFHAAAKLLRETGYEVFNPAERDEEVYGADVSADNPEGDPVKAAKDHDFDLRDAMLDNLHYLCAEAEAIALLPGWKDSMGAQAEFAVAKALGLKVIEL